MTINNNSGHHHHQQQQHHQHHGKNGISANSSSSSSRHHLQQQKSSLASTPITASSSTTSSSSSISISIGSSILFLGGCMIFFSLVKIYEAQQCTVFNTQTLGTFDLPSTRSSSNGNSIGSSSNSITNKSILMNKYVKDLNTKLLNNNNNNNARIASNDDEEEEEEEEADDADSSLPIPPLDAAAAAAEDNNSNNDYIEEEEEKEEDSTSNAKTILSIVSRSKQQQQQQVESQTTRIQQQQKVIQRKKTISTKTTQVSIKKLHFNCTLQTPPKHAKTLARIVVLQRDGRHQLRDFVQHYTKAVPYDSLVIMDHNSNYFSTTKKAKSTDTAATTSGSSSNTDQYTKALLEEYGKKGAHIWSCNGPFQAKRYMWTYITRVYSQDSAFVFPVDIDELLAVQVTNDVDNNVNNNDYNSSSNNNKELEWNIQAFRHALKMLPNKKSGKPLKMNWIESVPAECHVTPQQQQLTSTTTTTKTTSSSSVSDITMSSCDIQYVKYKKNIGCMDKTFARGYQFYQTDTGNHYGGTYKFPKLNKTVCETYGLENIYDMSSLVLIHLKEKTFEDWLIHGLRGATDRGFNMIYNIDCNAIQQSIHYCRKWEKIINANFSPYQLRKIFLDDVCPLSSPNDDMELMSAHKVFCHTNNDGYDGYDG